MAEQPVYPYLWFGNGHSAQMIPPIIRIVGERGEKLLEFTLRPTRELMIAYNIQEGTLNPQDGSLKKAYPETYIINLNMDPMVNRVICLCDFNGGTTPLLEMAAKDKDTIILLEQQLEIYKGANGRMQEEMEEIQTQIGKKITRDAEMYEKMSQSRGMGNVPEEDLQREIDRRRRENV